MRRIALEDALAGRASAAEADPAVRRRVAEIIAAVRAGGDPALERLRRELDGEAAGTWPGLEVPLRAIGDAYWGLDRPLRGALFEMAERVRAFAECQRSLLKDFTAEVSDGVFCGQRFRPVERVGCYVPGGRHALPSTAIMTGVVAKVAGVREVIFACPRPTPAVLTAAALAGADRVLAVGGAHAIAALAFGTERVPRVDTICGPGGVYVAEAKRQLAGQVGTDLPAGPSEVLVLADDTASDDRVFADLCAQAEHDPAARPLLGTTSEALAASIEGRVARGFAGQPNAAATAAAFATNGLVCVVPDRRALARLADALAPEHLALHVEDPGELMGAVEHFGAAFLGGEAAEVFGDYGAGPNHVLPTGGAARFTGGLSVATFLRWQTTLRLEPEAARRLAPQAALLARAEGLEAHARAAELRA